MALVFRLTWLGGLLTLLCGCQSLYFYPLKPWVQNPTNIGLDYQDVVLIHPDGQRIHGWWLPATGQARGTVLFLHGNAQNISTHIANVGWLVGQGVNVLAIDYRGYGLSDGKVSIDNALGDIQLAIQWLSVNPKTAERPLAVFGQSIGASLMMAALAEEAVQSRLSCAISEGAFAHYRDVMRDVLRQSLLLSSLRWMILPLAPRQHQPLDSVGELALPLLFLHSEQDEVIPLAHGKRLFEKAPEPKQWQALQGPHIGSAGDAGYRRVIVDYLATQCGFTAPASLEGGGPKAPRPTGTNGVDGPDNTGSHTPPAPAIQKPPRSLTF